MPYKGTEMPTDLSYLDALARELASDACVRCSGLVGWKTAALIYEGLEWKYYYCYECRQWFRRHFRYRYAVDLVDNDYSINLLVRHLDSSRLAMEIELESVSWLRRKFLAASRFFQRFLPPSNLAD